MKKIADQIAHFTRFTPGGQTLGELIDGRKIFAWGVLPGETAKIRVTKNKKSYAEGFAIDVIKTAPNRIEARDNCYLATSPWQILNWNDELHIKEQLTRESFAQAKIDLNIAPIATDNHEFGYRNKMEYALYFMSLAEAQQPNNESFLATFSDADLTRNYIDHDAQVTGGKVFLAFHQRGSHRKIPILHSSIERPEIFRRAQQMIDELNTRGEDAWKYQSLMVRASQNGEVSAVLFVNRQPHPIMKNLVDTILGHVYSYSPNGFFQINLPVYELALREIAQQLDASKNVVDMYSGVGTIGLSVAADRNLTLVETDDHAFAELQKNIVDDTCHSVRAMHAKAEEALEYITNDSTLILDPPRAGLDAAVCQKIRAAKPRIVIYLSCSPTTQARDVARILGNDETQFSEKSDYQITFARPFNFFPRTPHIENLIVLQIK